MTRAEKVHGGSVKGIRIMDHPPAVPQVDTSRPHMARIYDYFLGGKDNISQVVPGTPHSCRTVAIQARHVDYSKTGLLTRV